MQLKLQRVIRTDHSTIGELFINGIRECFTLEDKDRGLKQFDPIGEIAIRKVYGKTAIPSGTYEVILSFSNKYQKYMPLLLNVPGFNGIRMHSGNKPEDSLGCILMGQTKGSDFIGQSRIAVASFMSKLQKALKKGKVFITIV